MKPSKALKIIKHEAQLRVYGWGILNKEQGMMKLNDEGIFLRYRLFSRSRPESEHTIRPPAWELIWGFLNIEQGTRNDEVE